MHKVTSFLLQNFIPPIIPKVYCRFLEQGGGTEEDFLGNYDSWEEAKQDSTGYDTPEILEKVKSSLMKVRDGQAVCERESILFNDIQYSWPLLSALMWIACQSEGRLNVLDFGGSLGTTYFQNRRFLSELAGVRWNIVEQRHFVDAGKEYFENEELKFYYDIEACLKQTPCRTIIFSSVLQYVEKPYGLLHKVIGQGFDFILIDRTPFQDTRRDILRIQKVPEHIFRASYPIWFFSESKFRDFFRAYEIIAKFEALDHKPGKAYGFYGFIIKVKKGIDG
jgi:putative methyltransferase (TIGR04325 family)